MVLQQINSTNLLLIIFILLASFNFQCIAQLNITSNPSHIQFQCNAGNTPSPSFSSNLTRRLPELLLNLHFYNSKYMMATSGYTPLFYASYHCRGDVNSTRCYDCVLSVTQAARDHCFNTSTEAVVWGDVCVFRYSSQGFNGHRDESPWAVVYNDETVPESVNVTMLEQAVKSSAKSIADGLGSEAVNNYATLEANVSSGGSDDKIYVMGECTKDLVPNDCRVCVHDCANKIININNLEGNLKVGVRVMFPSCSFRYEMYRFYGNYNTAYRVKAAQPHRHNPRGSMAPQPSSNQTSTVSPASQTLDDPAGRKRDPHKWKRPSHDENIAGVGASLAVLLLVISGALFYAHRRKKNKQACEYMEEITSADSLQFEFSKIRSATHNFAVDKKLGQGGFGEVYKGKLDNGQLIAVKRLSKDSKQGIAEFKTEILLVANLQHRNLVKLLGFCFSGKEKILVYEYLANSSLDRVLFDPVKRESLNWETRFNIIYGIAKGLLYLHEDSRLKIIHRDLKTSNILLDDFMNPKISDFGMAKLFGVDQTQDATKTIVGTYGYMAPEYMLTGQYSVKSDIYSFGIIVLEMVTGLRNTYMSRPLLEEALLHRAWRVWNEGSALELVDYVLGDVYSREEVIKCIHIALLCIQEEALRRPQMTWVVAAIRGETNHFPAPTPPNFFNSIRRSASGSCSSTDPGVTSSSGGEISTDLQGR